MHTIRISVRNLVEFILRSGDIISSSTGIRDAEAMQEGTRIHKKIQNRMPSSYRPEVSLKYTSQFSKDGLDFSICVEGRADGIFPDSILPSDAEFPIEQLSAGDDATEETSTETIFIDEIKGIYRELSTLEAPIPVHRAQALCYAYIYATEHTLDCMGIRMTYCYIPTEEVRYFYERISYEELALFYEELLEEYAKWIAWQIRWQQQRNDSLHALEFPFPYREGQAKLVKGVYQSILREKRLYIEAPTGVGKTIATVFPSVKAMGESLAEKIFYLTAKTITRTVAENTFSLLAEHGTSLKCITLTAKDKICILDKAKCHPATCPQANGHFDRVNDAVFDLLTHENLITRELVAHYAEKHEVCPFEMGLDTATWCDVIIGDYNYAFDPDSHLKRFFSEESGKDYLFLIDEAHNLVSRAREMYSATLIKEDFLALKRMVKTKSKKLTAGLDSGNRGMLELKRKCDDMLTCTPAMIDGLIGKLLRLHSIFEDFLQNSALDERDIPEETMEHILDFYFSLRAFINRYELLDDNYLIYCDYNEQGEFQLHLQCMVPSANLDSYLSKGRAVIFFSATLLPIHYYREQLAGREDDYAIYAPSPFPEENRLLMIGRDVSTKYTLRGPAMYQRIASYIIQFVHARTGNYMVFFSSYRMMEDIYEYVASALDDISPCEIIMQNASMSEEEREEFLSHFEESPDKTVIALCVLGGIFGEGIDLKQERLIGAVIVGTGLPMVCNENELFRNFFKESGFSYAYQYPGMNKVLQAAGRVIRTIQDRGVILLLDERFLQQSYQALFPREWFPHYVVTQQSMQKHLQDFWAKGTHQER